jgi:hypothetical protein
VGPPHTRENINTAGPTFPLDFAILPTLSSCSLQTCSDFPLYEVLRSHNFPCWFHIRSLSDYYRDCIALFRRRMEVNTAAAWDHITTSIAIHFLGKKFSRFPHSQFRRSIHLLLSGHIPRLHPSQRLFSCGGVVFNTYRGCACSTPAHFMSLNETRSTYASSCRVKVPSLLQALQRCLNISAL